jgi:hypothetical protein
VYGVSVAGKKKVMKKQRRSKTKRLKEKGSLCIEIPEFENQWVCNLSLTLSSLILSLHSEAECANRAFLVSGAVLIDSLIFLVHLSFIDVASYWLGELENGIISNPVIFKRRLRMILRSFLT